MTAQEADALLVVLKQHGVTHFKTADLDVSFATTVKRAKLPIRKAIPTGSVDAIDLALQLSGRGEELEDGNGQA